MLRDHMFICNHKVMHEMMHESSRYLLELKEGLFIKGDKL